MRLREEKMEEQRVAQEERLKRALERAQADPKKRVRQCSVIVTHKCNTSPTHRLGASLCIVLSLLC